MLNSNYTQRSTRPYAARLSTLAVLNVFPWTSAFTKSDPDPNIYPKELGHSFREAARRPHDESDHSSLTSSS